MKHKYIRFQHHHRINVRRKTVKTAAISMETGSASSLADGAIETAMKLQCLKSTVVSCGTVIPACSNLPHLHFSHQYRRTALDFHV